MFETFTMMIHGFNNVFNQPKLYVKRRKKNLKAVWPHNGNQKPSVPTACRTKTNETYERIKQLLTCIQYEKRSSVARGATVLPIGMQSIQNTTFFALLRAILALKVKIAPHWH